MAYGRHLFLPSLSDDSTYDPFFPTEVPKNGTYSSLPSTGRTFDASQYSLDSSRLSLDSL